MRNETADTVHVFGKNPCGDDAKPICESRGADGKLTGPTRGKPVSENGNPAPSRGPISWSAAMVRPWHSPVN